MAGWILIHRKIQDHWLYENKRPKTKLEAWFHILLTVNFKSSTVHIRGNNYTCLRGQSLLSLESWAKEFNWSIQQVRTFFNLLKTDEMITIEGLQYTTRLTVCNYDTYQVEITDQQHAKQQADNTPLTDQQQTANNNINKGKKEIKENKDSDQLNLIDLKPIPKTVKVKVVKEKKEIEIPEYFEFKAYALENDRTIDLNSLEMKYKSWKENEWKDGNNKSIVNWRSKILNTLPYLKHAEAKTQERKIPAYKSLEGDNYRG